MSKTHHCISIDDVYGTGWMKNHQGELNSKFDWEFRSPKVHEQYISMYCGLGLETNKAPYNYGANSPYIVVTPKKPKDDIFDTYGMTKAQIESVLDNSYELTGEFREPMEGDYFISDGTSASKAHIILANSPWHATRLIVRKKKSDFELAYQATSVSIPLGYKWTGEFREPKDGDTFLTIFRDAEQFYVGYNLEDEATTKRLILEKRASKVTYTVEAKPRLPKTGESFWSEDRWLVAQVDFKDNKYLCGTRHEQPDTTIQVVTQADIDKTGKA